MKQLFLTFWRGGQNGAPEMASQTGDEGSWRSEHGQSLVDTVSG
ncbi:MAG TPA: hypothetical protein VKB88_03000 [Bryobacteraceae bacterium]|nr:hypothetical protein [Bryobacteraceae bacterium]